MYCRQPRLTRFSRLSTTICPPGDAHGTSTPATAFAQDKTSNKGGLEPLRLNLAIFKLLEEQSANDMDPLPPRCVRQTTHIEHVEIEGLQFTADVIPLLHSRNLALDAKYMQQVPDSDAQLVAQSTNRRSASAEWQMSIQELALRHLIDQGEVQTFIGCPLREVGNACKIHAHGVGMISARSKIADIPLFDGRENTARQPATRLRLQ